MSDAKKKLELEVEVVGTPEEVWEAIATGPGISSWYVPHTVEEREGGAATAAFGDGPEMQVPGSVTAWDPPRRITFEGADGGPGLAFEWLIEARDGGACVVRLVNSGFGEGAEWDDQYDAMKEGWGLFLRNLQLHCRHFAGQHATPMLPTGMWSGDAWTNLTTALAIPPSAEVGSRLTLVAADDLQIAGMVEATGPTSLALVLDQPAPGTAIVAAEGGPDASSVSVWCYFYGPDAASIVQRDKPRWQAWLDARAGELPA